MGRLMDCKDTLIDDNSDQSHVPMSPNGVQTSPLDLSLKNRPFLFSQRSSSPLNLSSKPNQINCRQMSVDDVFDPPEVLTQPKREWHYRSVKDLAKKHLPYLAGNGPQRTPVRIRVPEMSVGQMYLAIGIMTIDDKPHPSKVIVPAKTYVNTEYLSHDNNLDCLRFDQCNSADEFDAENKYIYSKISEVEHQVGYKEIRVHMFNLYQNHSITKDMIITKQLHQCKLAFWLCVRRNNKYMTISQASFSTIIEEKKMTTRSRASAQINQPTLVSNPYAAFYIDYNNNQDSIDEDDSS